MPKVHIHHLHESLVYNCLLSQHVEDLSREVPVESRHVARSGFCDHRTELPNSIISIQNVCMNICQVSMEKFE